MKVDDRSKLLLLDIVKNDTVTIDELRDRHNLTTRQVDYSIKKMNNLLIDRGIPIITRTAQGKFNIDKRIYTLFNSPIDHSIKELFVSDSTDRATLMILIMLVRQADFSINFFTYEFKISKNTVLNDLKHAKKIIKPFNLTINYSRVVGYEIIGKEWDIRNVMIHSINHVMNQLDGERYLNYFMEISEEAYNQINRNLEEVEKKLDLFFVDTKTTVLPYIVLGVLFRIELGHNVNGIFFIDYQELADTREFDAVNVLIKDTVISEEEKLYFTLHLLSSNVYQTELPLVEELPQLREAIITFVDEFERVAFTTLSNKERLIDKIFIHFKPAYYRIKYQLTTDYKLVPSLDDEYEPIHNLIKEAMAPLINYLGVQLPEIETRFLSMLIGSHLIEESNQLDAKFRGIIVCQNGISFSNLLEHSLKKIFPELFFYPPMSLKEMRQTSEPYDLIFASIPLESDKPVFFVSDLSKDLDIISLRNKVMSVLYQFGGINITIEEIISTAEKHAKKLDREKLRKDLLEVFSPTTDTSKNEEKVEERKNLTALLPEEMIIKVQRVNNWFEGLDLVSQPLLKKGLIDHNYLSAIKQEQPTLKSQIVLRENIAIPHSSPQKTTRLGMGLLILEEPLIYEEEKEISFIVMIASPNKKAHFKALIELLEIADDDLFLHTLKTASAKEIAERINTYNYRKTEEEN